jgi:hypothetical protein
MSGNDRHREPTFAEARANRGAGITRARRSSMSVRARSSSIAILAHALVIPCALALAACSGAGNEDLFQPSQSNDSTTPSPSTSDKPSSSNGATTPPTKDTGPAQQAEACTPEAEPNNDVDNATSFTTGLCGKIGNQNDVDYGTFDVPGDAKSITIKHAETGGKVTYRYSFDGVPISLQGDQLKAIPGATYTVQIRLDRSGGGNGGLPSYELGVSFN